MKKLLKHFIFLQLENYITVSIQTTKFTKYDLETNTKKLSE